MKITTSTLLFTLVLFWGCNNKQNPDTADKSDTQPKTELTESSDPKETKTENKQSDIVQLQLIYKMIEKDGMVQAIEVYDEQSKTLRQTIDGFEAEAGLQEKPEEVDVNFDGYDDILVKEFLPAGANIPHLCWLYNPQTEQFERFEAFEKITSPKVDAATKTITSNWNSGAANYGTDVYQYENGELVMVKREEKVYSDENNFKRIVSERVNGEMKVIKEENVSKTEKK